MERYVHYSDSPLVKIKSRRQSRVRFDKPVGLWLSVVDERGDGWRDWCGWENFRTFDENTFATEIELDLSVLRVIRTVAEIDAFDGDFGESYAGIAGILWPAVAQFYSGVLISPHLWQRRSDGRASSWYHDWDCASACIWDASAARIITLDARRKCSIVQA